MFDLSQTIGIAGGIIGAAYLFINAVVKRKKLYPYTKSDHTRVTESIARLREDSDKHETKIAIIESTLGSIDKILNELKKDFKEIILEFRFNAKDIKDCIEKQNSKKS